MKILVANMKGGMGKTHLALNLALRFNYNVLTNDSHSLISKIIGTNGLVLDEGQPIPPTPDGFNVIYDMGGKADSRLIDAAKLADVVVIPFISDTFFDMQATVATIAAIEKHNNNILIVANKTQKGDYSRVRKDLNEFFQYPILELKQSTAFKTAIHEKRSIQAIINANPLALRSIHYKKPAKQLDAVMKKARSMVVEVVAV